MLNEIELIEINTSDTNNIELIEVEGSNKIDLVELSMGLRGEKGNSVTNVTIDEDGYMYTTYSDGNVEKSGITALAEARALATQASASATSAATSATNAATSESNAKSSEANAKTSETNASTYATNASASATSANTSASSAKTYAQNANTYKTQAQSSATVASEQATSASGYATSASSSASSALTSATNASTSASEANSTLTTVNTVYKDILAMSESLASALKYRGSVEYYSTLPTVNEVGDMWMIKNADEEHDILSGDIVVWNGESWDKFSGAVDTSMYAETEDLSTVAFSGSYTDLTNRPTIPTTTSALTNDSDFATNATVNTKLGLKANTADLATVATTGDYEDVINTPTKLSEFTNDTGYITKDAIPTTNSSFTNDSGYITKDSIPTNVSEFANDSEYISQSDLTQEVTRDGTTTPSNYAVSKSLAATALAFASNLVKAGLASYDSETGELSITNPVTNYLPLTGGTITGDINYGDDFHVANDSNKDMTNIDIGWDYDSGKGSGLGLRSAENANAGYFSLYARSGDTYKALEGRPDGTLQWGGKIIPTLSGIKVFATSNRNGYIKFSQGLIIQWLGIDATTSGTTFTWPTAWSDSESFLAVATRRSSSSTTCAYYNIQASSTTQSKIYANVGGYASIIAVGV